MSLLHTEGLLRVGEEEEEKVHTQYALVEKWREVEKERESTTCITLFFTRLMIIGWNVCVLKFYNVASYWLIWNSVPPSDWL